MRSRTPTDLAGRCPRCWQRLAPCLCAAIPRVEAGPPIRILRHHREAWKTSNTARIAALALPRARLVDRAGRDDPELPWLPGAWLLFPGDGPPLSGYPSELIVVDGTWRQASRLVRAVPGLADLPRLSLPEPAAPGPRLRHEHLPEGRSTLEAIAAALARLEGDAAARPLLELHAAFVARLRRERGRPPA